MRRRDRIAALEKAVEELRDSVIDQKVALQMIVAAISGDLARRSAANADVLISIANQIGALAGNHSEIVPQFAQLLWTIEETIHSTVNLNSRPTGGTHART